MELYLDTANLKHIDIVNKLGFMDGVTTNPTILSKEERPPFELIQEIDRKLSGKIWYQVTGFTADESVEEATKVANMCHNKVVIKFPFTLENLEGIRRVSQKGIETNATLVYSIPQAIFAAKAGATYISPYLGRIDDAGGSSIQFINDVKQAYENLGFYTKIIGASIRNSQHLVDLSKNGIDALTISYANFEKMLHNTMTDAGMEQFQEDWDKIKNL
ncbi:transaldolase family protein [Lentibacillus sp.]|uniref:transaldolase family protein n=1 Tax=Lentibacillus sp. TaxID=1925746 RepID=UPI002B4B8488|nr:transaldolase family protein [Lentibacillus sp.]HLS08311.1 transaldolase family protein [Lentibacillus sp.]